MLVGLDVQPLGDRHRPPPQTAYLSTWQETPASGHRPSSTRRFEGASTWAATSCGSWTSRSSPSGSRRTQIVATPTWSRPARAARDQRHVAPQRLVQAFRPPRSTAWRDARAAENADCGAAPGGRKRCWRSTAARSARWSSASRVHLEHRRQLEPAAQGCAGADRGTTSPATMAATSVYLVRRRSALRRRLHGRAQPIWTDLSRSAEQARRRRRRGGSRKRRGRRRTLTLTRAAHRSTSGHHEPAARCQRRADRPFSPSSEA